MNAAARGTTRVRAADGTELHCECTGDGTAVVFVHEFAGDHRTWEPQVRRFSRSHRCVTFGARGYPPSEVPREAARYSQDLARGDVIAVMDSLGIERAHLVGHSMGAYTALHVGIHHPERCLSITAAGCGWGSSPADAPKVAEVCGDIARMFREEPLDVAADKYANAPMRLTFKAKDPRGFAEFARMLGEHSALGLEMTMLNVQAKRPSLGALEAQLKAMQVPLLVLVGDEDFPCLDGSLFLKRTVPTAALMVVPRSGHTITSEEPDTFNAALAEIFAACESGRWMAHRGTAMA
ncbi:MAG TPA: alpha/beta hydrolase [Usitatibacter sp.]|nr:alpha/beta hydrolase [Usitatibacter sp.]